MMGGIAAVFVVTLLVVALTALTARTDPSRSPRSHETARKEKSQMPEKITLTDGVLNVPDNPIIPYIEGDGTGVDIWPAAQLVHGRGGEEARQDDRVEGGARRREGVQPDRQLAARRDRRRRSASTSSGSRARSPRRSAAASAR